jgi:putative chitinase
MIKLTTKHIKDVMPTLGFAKMMQALPLLNIAMHRFQILDNGFRAAAFLAQVAHESCELRHMQETWGPTPQQLCYDPPNSLAERLGNTEPGHGFLYRGRGPIPITGRANYRRFNEELRQTPRIDLLAAPDLVATPEYAFLASAWFWQSRGLNALADVEPGEVVSLKDLIKGESFIDITRKINAGTVVLKKRRQYYARALATLVGPVLPKALAATAMEGQK